MNELDAQQLLATIAERDHEIEMLQSRLDDMQRWANEAFSERDRLRSKLEDETTRRQNAEVARRQSESRLHTATRLLGVAVKEWAGWKDDARGTEPDEPEYAEALAFLSGNEPAVERREHLDVGALVNRGTSSAPSE